MKRFICYGCWLTAVLTTSCKTSRPLSANTDDGKIDIVLIQVNDVYEIAPLSGGKEGGLARVATLKKKYLRSNPNTFLVLAGDFVSPSVYNGLQYEGKAIRGRHMIETLNAAGLDLAVFGNHEFDIKEKELQERIDESHFQWIASNAFHRQNGTVSPFANTATGVPFPQTLIMNVQDKDGTTARIGFIGLTLPFNKTDYVAYTDPLTAAKEAYHRLKDSTDAIIAITHQSIDDDRTLARELPQLTLIMGGHEHDMHLEKEGKIYITKAQANARSAFAVTLKINKRKGNVQIDPQLKNINESLPLDSVTNTVVEKWTDIADKAYSSLGFNARKVVISEGEPLEGRETEVRSHPTNLTKLAVAGMAAAAPAADLVLLNAGSIRVDDVLQMPVTQYDIIRSMPFGGAIREADMKGALLIKTLEGGRSNKGIGGFLLHNEAVSLDTATGVWKLGNNPVDPAKTYRVATLEFLLSGKEANLDFLHPGNPDLVKIYDGDTSVQSPLSDVRLAIIKYLENKK